jgi:biopolymer transport protein ExbD
MAATVQTKSGDVVVDMNTTPLIDVMLVLLTLLIITLPMQKNAIKIDTGPGKPPATPPTIVNLSVDFDGATSWNGTVVDRATLDSYLADAAQKDPQPNIIIRADRLTKYDRVATVLSDAARAGETHIGFADTAGP